MTAHRRRIIVIGFLALLGTFLGCAEVTEPSIGPAHTSKEIHLPLTHAEAIRLASSAAPTAAAWRARLDGARAALMQSRRLPNPGFEASWEDFGLWPGSTNEVLQQTFSLTAALADICARPYRERAAEFELRAEEAAVRAEIADLSAEVVAAYDDIVFLRQRAAALGAAAKAQKERADALRRLVKQGLESSFRAETAAVDLLEADGDAFTARSAAEIAEVSFTFAIGCVRPLPELLLADEPDTTSADAARDLESMLTEAAVSRPELEEADFRYRATLERARLEAHRLRFLPTPGFGGRTVDGDARGTATLNVELPIFDDGEAESGRNDAELLASAATARRSAATVASEVTKARLSVVQADETLDRFVRQELAERRRLRELAGLLFDAGEISLDERDAATAQMLAAEVAEIDALAKCAAARTTLAHALGRFAPHGER